MSGGWSRVSLVIFLVLAATSCAKRVVQTSDDLLGAQPGRVKSKQRSTEGDSALEAKVEKDEAEETEEEADLADGTEADEPHETEEEADSALETEVQADDALEALTEAEEAHETEEEADLAVETEVDENEADEALETEVEAESALETKVEVDEALEAETEIDEDNFESVLQSTLTPEQHVSKLLKRSGKLKDVLQKILNGGAEKTGIVRKKLLSACLMTCPHLWVAWIYHKVGCGRLQSKIAKAKKAGAKFSAESNGQLNAAYDNLLTHTKILAQTIDNSLALRSGLFVPWVVPGKSSTHLACQIKWLNEKEKLYQYLYKTGQETEDQELFGDDLLKTYKLSHTTFWTPIFKGCPATSEYAYEPDNPLALSPDLSKGDMSDNMDLVRYEDLDDDEKAERDAHWADTPPVAAQCLASFQNEGLTHTWHRRKFSVFQGVVTIGTKGCKNDQGDPVGLVGLRKPESCDYGGSNDCKKYFKKKVYKDGATQYPACIVAAPLPEKIKSQVFVWCFHDPSSRNTFFDGLTKHWEKLQTSARQKNNEDLKQVDLDALEKSSSLQQVAANTSVDGANEHSRLSGGALATEEDLLASRKEAIGMSTAGMVVLVIFWSICALIVFGQFMPSGK